MGVELRRQAFVKYQHKFCPGCGHGIINRLIAEVLDEKSQLENNLISLAVGCCCNMSAYWGGDLLQTAHGRASSTSRGIRAAQPNLVIISYQGDGDAYVIGLADTLNLAYVNENVTMIVVNNNNFAMTGGQMSWTSISGQSTTTSITGRDTVDSGPPLKVPEMIVNAFPYIAYAARGSTLDALSIRRLKRFITAAIESQMAGEGFSIVEVLSQCPTNWNMDLGDAVNWIKEAVIPQYPLGVLKERATINGK